MIRVLDGAIADQIAAGEVVERPASVVKELVENALDAGAARIEVRIERGGADGIRVADDGAGMSREDALLACSRHATSKIAAAEDLRAIRTYGFRGEALPAIASVSRLALTSAPAGGEGGTRVRVHAGALVSGEPAAHPRGTTVEVEGLFHNAPARRKFLRSPATETAHVADAVAAAAAAHPAVAFRLQSGGRDLLNYPAVAGLRDRVAQILGAGETALCVPVRHRSGTLRVEGLVSAPSLSRSSGRDQHLFVNGRSIRDRRLLHAIQEGYATLLPRGRYPVVYLYLEVPCEEVDVNVHPAKSEVRFLRAAVVHDVVRDAILAAHGAGRAFTRLAAPSGAVSEPAPGFTIGGGLAGRAAAGGAVAAGGDAGIPAAAEAAAPVVAPGGDDLSGPAPAPLFDAVAVAPLAQFRDSYILASAPDGLVIVDQHAAHERVLYERLMDEAESRGVERQRLLFPLTLEVSPAERQACEEAAEDLARMGLGVAPFGDGAILVDESPAIVPPGRLERLVRDLLHEVLEWPRAEGVARLRHRMAATAACHAAVTANHPLDGGRMRRIVDDLLRTRQPMTCPHGRPVLLRLSLAALEKEFRRR